MRQVERFKEYIHRKERKMRQVERFKKYIQRFENFKKEDLIFRVYCLERYIERLERIFNDCELISDGEASDFRIFLEKGGLHA